MKTFLLKNYFLFCIFLSLPVGAEVDSNSLILGLLYPQEGPYASSGLDQWRAAHLAIDEINAAGGILGKHVRLAWRDTQSNADVAADKTRELIEGEGAAMIFGGASSSVALSVGETCRDLSTPFFATLSYAIETTGIGANRYMFRECYNSRMGAKALSFYLNEHFQGQRYFYLSADYMWGHTTEKLFRESTETTDKDKHPGVFLPFPDLPNKTLRKGLLQARESGAEVVMLLLFGNHLQEAIKIIHELELDKQAQIVVHGLALSMADGVNPDWLTGIVGAIPWCWRVPYEYDYPRGRAFVETYKEYYGRYPSSPAASIYMTLLEYKSAVERAGSCAAKDVILALEDKGTRFLVIPQVAGHEYTLLKDKQVWRSFDHQSVQTVYIARCRPVVDEYGMDLFEIIGSLSGDEAAIPFDEWKSIRGAAGKSPWLQPAEL